MYERHIGYSRSCGEVGVVLVAGLLAVAGNVYETFKLADPFKVLIAEVDCHFFFLRNRVSLTLECPAF